MYTLYRYEHPESKKGPYHHSYNNDDICYKISKAHNNDYKRPAVQEDGLDFITKDYKVACDNLSLLHDWFSGFNEKLIKEGFVIVEYLVKCKFDGKSKRQSIFHLDAVIDRKVLTE